jgi:DNA-binding transcriptional regulator YiaG
VPTVSESEPAVPEAIVELITQAHLGKLPTPSRRRRIREDAGVSLRAAARALGVDVMTVSRWEQGATPRTDKRLAYRQLLDGLERAASP